MLLKYIQKLTCENAHLALYTSIYLFIHVDNVLSKKTDNLELMNLHFKKEIFFKDAKKCDTPWEKKNHFFFLVRSDE